MDGTCCGMCWLSEGYVVGGVGCWRGRLSEGRLLEG